MATLPVVEGGQIMLRGAQGGVPMAQISPGQVEPIAARAAAQQAGTMAQILDRMSASAFQEAGRLAPLEAMQFVADNPITPEQIAIAKNGLPIARRGSGNIFDEAVAKARSFELASHFEQEGKNELVKMLADIKTNPDKVDAQQLSQKIASISNGYSKAIAPTDPEAALKFRATMATHGNTVLNAAYQEQAKFNQQKNLIKLTQDLDNVQQLLYAAAKYDPNNFDALADTHRENLLKQALTIGSAQEYEQTQNRIRTIIRQTKIDAISDELSMNDSYFENPRQTEREIRTGLVRSEQRFNPMLSNLIARDGQAVEEILKRFRAQYAARQNFIEAEYKDANQKADGILQQIYTSRDRAQATNLFNSLAELPVSPEKIKAARTWIDGDAIAGPQRDDLEQLGDLNQRISVGAATQQDIINAPGITRRTKEQMLSRFSNVTDDIGAATRSIERSVGIFSASLPPELPTPQARALAVKTRNENVGALYEFARTLGPDGKLPSPPQIRAHGDMLAEQSRKIISEAFVVIAPAAEQEARMMLQELSGVNLLDEKAVTEAFKKAAERGAQQTTINSARDAVNRFRDANAKSGAAR